MKGELTHVTIKNTWTNILTNIIIHYGGTLKPNIISILNPGEKVFLSLPDGSELEKIQLTTDSGLNITKKIRTPVSASFVGNSDYGG